MGVETGLCSRLTLAHSRDWSECVAEGLGINLEPSWASCRETLLPLSRGGPDLALLRGLPGWPSLPGAAPLPPGFLTADPAQHLTGPCGGCSGTHSKPPLTCLRPARVKIDVSTAATSAASTFSHLSPCQCSFSEWSMKYRAEPPVGALRRSLAARERPIVPGDNPVRPSSRPGAGPAHL